MSSSSGLSGQEPGDSAHRPGELGGARVQPHGLVLLVREPQLRIVQASTSAAHWLQRPLDTLLLATLRDLGGDLLAQVQAATPGLHAADLQPHQHPRQLPLRCTLGGAASRHAVFEGQLSRIDGETLRVELEPLPADDLQAGIEGLLLHRLGVAVQRVSEAASLAELSLCAARWAQQLSGYDRAATYTSDRAGAVQLAAQVADAQRPAWPLADTSPASPPQLARHVGLWQRVHAQADTGAEACELLPAMPFGSGLAAGSDEAGPGSLYSLPRAQLQQLHDGGVVATVCVSVLHEGLVWGWLVCDHRQARRLPATVRAALELLAEAVGTRIAAIEHHARSRVVQELRGLEQRLVEATSVEGDWRQALVRESALLLQPLHASGAVLFQGGEIFACGEVPPPPELRMLLKWLSGQPAGDLLSCSSLEALHPTLAALAPSAARVLAVRLSAGAPDWLVWLRSSTPQVGPRDDWSRLDQATAAGFGRTLAGISVQVFAVRMLIAETQLAQLRASVSSSRLAVVVTCANPHTCQANEAFYALIGRPPGQNLTLDSLLALFVDREAAHRVIGQVRAEQRPWRGELALRLPDGRPLPVAVRAEPVPARDDSLLGFILMIEDLSASHEAEAARRRLEDALTRTERGLRSDGHADLVGAILVNAGIAAMDISDDGLAEATATLLGEVEASTARAAALFKRIRGTE